MAIGLWHRSFWPSRRLFQIITRPWRSLLWQKGQLSSKHCTGDERKNLPEKCPDILQCRGEVGWYGQYPGKHQIDTRIIKCHGCLRRRYSVSIGIKRMQKNPLCFQEFYFLSLAELLCAFCVMHDCVCAQLLQSLFAGMLSFVVETGRTRFRESVRLSGCTSGLSVLRLCRTQNAPNIADVGALPLFCLLEFQKMLAVETMGARATLPLSPASENQRR